MKISQKLLNTFVGGQINQSPHGEGKEVFSGIKGIRVEKGAICLELTWTIHQELDGGYTQSDFDQETLRLSIPRDTENAVIDEHRIYLRLAPYYSITIFSPDAAPIKREVLANLTLA